MNPTHLTRSLAVNGNLSPVALDYLGSIPDSLLHHRNHCLRHPWSLYKISLDQVFTAFEDVLERFSRIRECVGTSDETRQFQLLMNSYRGFLYTLREHIDDCYLVFKTLIPPQTVKPTRFQAEFLKRANFKELPAFEKSIEWYLKEHLGLLVNALKHHQGRLRWLYFHRSDDFRPGYFLEQIGADGAVGPSQSIHKGNTAFSFCKDIKLHLYAVYYISQILVDAVMTAVARYSGSTLNPSVRVKADEFKQTLGSVAQIELNVFPNELEGPCALVSLTSTEEDTALHLSYPESAPNKNFPSQMKISGVPMWADDFTRTFRLPYFRGA